jgi:hypothetical protein
MLDHVAEILAVRRRAATYQVTTTTSPQTHTIASFRALTGTTCTIDWGDGSQDTYTATASAKTHVYATAGTYRVTLLQAGNVHTLSLNENTVTLNSADVRSMVNVNDFRITTLKAGRFDSVDVSAWRPTAFLLYTMPSGYAGTFNSTDVSAWRPTNFYLHSMPTGYAGTFNSTDVSAWRPTIFYLSIMPSGYAGTFNSTDVSAWRPTNFYMYIMPSGYAGTFSSTDVSAWRPTNFYMYGMPVATFAITHTANSFAAWTTTNNFQMQGNSFLSATVNAILYDLYQASIAPRTATGGTINVAGNNQAPSGTLQACASPPVSASTPGKEIAYELKNDSLAVGFNKWATVTTS